MTREQILAELKTTTSMAREAHLKQALANLDRRSPRPLIKPLAPAKK